MACKRTGALPDAACVCRLATKSERVAISGKPDPKACTKAIEADEVKLSVFASAKDNADALDALAKLRGGSPPPPSRPPASPAEAAVAKLGAGTVLTPDEQKAITPEYIKSVFALPDGNEKTEKTVAIDRAAKKYPDTVGAALAQAKGGSGGAGSVDSILLQFLDNPYARRNLSLDPSKVTTDALEKVWQLEEISIFVNDVENRAEPICRDEIGKCSTSDVRRYLIRGLNAEIDKMTVAIEREKDLEKKESLSKRKNELDRILTLVGRTLTSGWKPYVGFGNATRQSAKSQDILDGIGFSSTWTPPSHTGPLGETIGSGLRVAFGLEKEMFRFTQALAIAGYAEGDVTKMAVRRDSFGRNTDGFWQWTAGLGLRLMQDVAVTEAGVFRAGVYGKGGVLSRDDSAFVGSPIAPGYTMHSQFVGYHPMLAAGLTAEWTFLNAAFLAFDIGYIHVIQEKPLESIPRSDGTSRAVGIENDGVDGGWQWLLRGGFRF